MYLKSIELLGFKSFADKTILTFEPGIIAVVGPNGSGKSNIADAVRWVMGEISAKNLRGGKMEDVIFSGTHSRKPVNFAEVSLTLDNSDKVFPLDFSEVTVTRRVYRSGESEYYINRAQCRLKDIHELFMDTGLGRNGYSIIGQGEIGDIISSKSEDRRGIFEEAAGIAKYRHRKEEAERKLAHTQENLVRIGDIVHELSSQLEPLCQQSEKAKKYLRLREELKVLEINIALREIDKNKKLQEEISENFSLVTEELESLKAATAEQEAELERLGILLEEHDQKIEQARGAYAKAESEVASYIREIEVLKANAEANRQMAKRLESDAAQIEESLCSLNEAKKEILDQLAAKRLAHDKEQAKMSELSAQSAELNEKIAKKNERLDQIKADIIEKLNDAASLKTKTTSLETIKQNFVQRRQALEMQLGSADDEKKRIDELLVKAREQIAKIGQAVKEKTDARKKIQTRQNEMQSEAKKIEEKIKNTEMEYHRKLSRLQMLREMEKEFEGFNRSVKTVLSAWKAGKLSGVHGALSALLDVSSEYVVAIEVALGAALQYVVVDEESDAKAAIELLKRQNKGRVTFLPISSVKGRLLDGVDEIKKQKGYIGIASEVISCDKKYDGIVKNLLGRTVLIDNMDNAIAMSKRFSYRFRIVTLDGEVLNAGGAITGGSVNRATGLLSRADELKRLKDQTETLKKSIEQLRASINGISEEQKTLLSKAIALDNEISALEREQVREQANLEHARQLMEALSKSKESMQRELEQIEKQIYDTNEQIARAINDTTKDEFEIESAKAEAAGYEQELSSLMQEKERLNLSITHQSIQKNSIEKDIASLNLRMQETQSRIDAAESEAKAKRAEIESINAQNQKIVDDISKKSSLANQVQDKMAELSGLIDRLNGERSEAQRRIKEKSPSLKDYRERLFAIKEEQNRLENRRTKAQMEIDNISARLWEDYEITYTTAQEYKKDIASISGASRKASELKKQIRELGNINIDAIEEYKSVRERFDFLTGQINDLTEAKEDLEKLISEIQAKMKKQFEKQFSIIQKHFSEVFVRLFGGGQAQLRLTDPSDVLQSGVEIDVQPPGKKLRGLAPLSGGEKALCAIALLFAILKARPAPFCVFDEIEAALDEPNVYRFADYLKEYSRTTQFIIVTHRRGTMEAASLLYGVTMQERGVSKLLRLELEEAKKL